MRASERGGNRRVLGVKESVEPNCYWRNLRHCGIRILGGRICRSAPRTKRRIFPSGYRRSPLSLVGPCAVIGSIYFDNFSNAR